MADEFPLSDVTQVISKEELKELKTIPIVCPWCNKIYKVTKWQVEKNRRTGISHGICPQCYKKMKKSAKAFRPTD